MNSDSRGQIITFYSYKGGTGRSMALANIACILAERQSIGGGKGVLMIDWDLEAPGLHRYFRNKLAPGKLALGRSDASHDEKPGLIDLFYDLNDRTDYYSNPDATAPSSESSDLSLSKEQLARVSIEAVDLQQYILPTTLKGLDLLKSGRFSRQNPNEYSERVNKFNWEALYKKSPHLIRIFAETLAKDYAYVLIDSRTGITDISGICTMLLPEKLVVVFTPNLQSLKGGLELVRRATDYRKESADLRPLVVFPLVARVEMSEPELRHDWRFGNKDTDGYQPEFEKVLAAVYEKERIRLDQYFDEMQIQHIPKYAYGEEIAVLSEKTWDKFSLRRSYRSFANKLIDSQSPWVGEIKEEAPAAGVASSFATLGSSVIGLLSLSGATRAVRAAIVVMLLLFASFTLAFSYRQTERAEAALTSLDQARRTSAESEQEAALLAQEAESLREEVRKLREQSPDIIRTQAETIEALNDQLTKVSQEANDSKQAVLTANNKAADALRAKTQAENEGNQQRRMALTFGAQALEARKEIEAMAAQLGSLQFALSRCRGSKSLGNPGD